MPLPFDPRAGWAESDKYTFIGRIETFTVRDSSPEHKELIGASPDTYVGQIVFQVSGVSMEWVGEDGNLWSWTGDLFDEHGTRKTHRRGKAAMMLAPLIAPEDEQTALRQGFRKRDTKTGKMVGAPGLGFDPNDPAFPECLESRQAEIALTPVEWGGDFGTSLIPIITGFRDDYVFEGDSRPQRSYGGRPSSGEGAAAATTSVPQSTLRETAPPSAFFDAIAGARFTLQGLYKAIQDAGLDYEPYRSLVVDANNRQKLLESGLIAVADDKTVSLGPGAGIVEMTIADLQAALDGEEQKVDLSADIHPEAEEEGASEETP